MIRLNAHFDGKVIVPDEPIDLPLNTPLTLEIEETPAVLKPNGAAIIAAFERAQGAFTEEDLDAMEAAHDRCERIEEGNDEDLRF